MRNKEHDRTFGIMAVANFLEVNEMDVFPEYKLFRMKLEFLTNKWCNCAEAEPGSLCSYDMAQSLYGSRRPLHAKELLDKVLSSGVWCDSFKTKLRAHVEFLDAANGFYFAKDQGLSEHILIQQEGVPQAFGWTFVTSEYSHPDLNRIDNVYQDVNLSHWARGRFGIHEFRTEEPKRQMQAYHQRKYGKGIKECRVYRELPSITPVNLDLPHATTTTLSAERTSPSLQMQLELELLNLKFSVTHTSAVREEEMNFVPYWRTRLNLESVEPMQKDEGVVLTLKRIETDMLE